MAMLMGLAWIMGVVVGGLDLEPFINEYNMLTLGPKISFQLYLRLALLMGLTWIMGVVAGGLDLEPVWYVFLVLNTLQVSALFVRQKRGKMMPSFVDGIFLSNIPPQSLYSKRDSQFFKKSQKSNIRTLFLIGNRI
jgi:hypothetical protein